MRTGQKTLGAAVLALLLTIALAACGSSSEDSGSSGTTTASKQTLNVFGAASLETAFTALGAEFEDAHPGTNVTFNFDSSTILSQQIEDNPGTADVFASADEKNMQKLRDAGEVTGTPTVFAKNQMEIAVEPGNPEGVKTVADLSNPKLSVVLCATEAPCGKYADQLLEQNNVKLTPKSRELNATSALGKVSSADADAAIVYVTDVNGAGSDVSGVAIPTSQNVVATLPIAVLKSSKNTTLADEWVDFLTSSSTEQTLQQTYGFLAAVSRRRRPIGVRPPAAVVVLAVVGLLVFFVAPLAGLVQRAPWGDLWSTLTAPETRTALRLSLECSLAATALAIVFGLPIAWLLARTEFRGKAIVRAFALLPLVLPPVVGGVALSFSFGRRGLVGQYLYRWFDMTFPFTTKGVILAETFVAMPFLIVTVEAALRSLDTRYEDAGATLGAGRWTILRRITLPAIAPSLAAGAALTWARALGEFGATITFAGNFKGVTQTLPLAVYLALETDRGSAIVLSLMLLVVSITVLALVGRRMFGARPFGVAAS